MTSASATSHGDIPGIGDCAFWIRIDSPVRSKSNYRNAARGSARSAWKSLKAFADSVALQVRAARPSSWQVPTLEQALPQRPVCVAVLLARTTVDAGNVSKSILDALEGVIVANDAEVKCVLEAVERSRSGQGFMAAFAQLPAGTPMSEAVVACSRLAEYTLEQV